MSVFDVEPEDMTSASVLDEKLNALLAGQRPAPGDELGSELSFMLEQVRQAFPPVVVPEQVEDVHFARMMNAAAGLSADVTAPMAVAQGPAAITAPSAPVRAGFLDKIRAGLSHRMAAAMLALTTAFGGAAYAGILPPPIQSAVANAAAAIGLKLPHPGDEASAVVDEDERDDHHSGEVTDTRPDDDHRRGDTAGHAGANDGDDERKGAAAGSDDDEGRDDRADVRDEDRDDDDYVEDDAEADDATSDHDGDSEDRSESSDDRDDANSSDPGASGGESDDDSHETDEPEGSSDGDALLEDSSEAEFDV